MIRPGRTTVLLLLLLSSCAGLRPGDLDFRKDIPPERLPALAKPYDASAGLSGLLWVDETIAPVAPATDRDGAIRGRIDAGFLLGIGYLHVKRASWDAAGKNVYEDARASWLGGLLAEHERGSVRDDPSLRRAFEEWRFLLGLVRYTEQDGDRSITILFARLPLPARSPGNAGD